MVHSLTHTYALTVSCLSTNKGRKICRPLYRNSFGLVFISHIVHIQYCRLLLPSLSNLTSCIFPISHSITFQLSNIHLILINSYFLTREKLLYTDSLRKVISFIKEYPEYFGMNLKAALLTGLKRLYAHGTIIFLRNFTISWIRDCDINICIRREQKRHLPY